MRYGIGPLGTIHEIYEIQSYSHCGRMKKEKLQEIDVQRVAELLRSGASTLCRLCFIAAPKEVRDEVLRLNDGGSDSHGTTSNPQRPA